jgi:Transglycosylase SLT domain
VLTLALGVTGGLFLDDEDDRAERAAANMAAFEQAEQIEFRLQKQHLAEVLRDEAIERARLKAEAEAAAEAARKRAAEEAARKNRPAPSFGPIPTSCQQYSGNRAIGCTLMLQAGYGLDQFPCLEKLWTKESGWSTSASNPSGAYGIPQALPGDKMAVYGSDWRTNPATQIKWGLSYIKSRYSTPCGAWQHFLDTGWY